MTPGMNRATQLIKRIKLSLTAKKTTVIKNSKPGLKVTLNRVEEKKSINKNIKSGKLPGIQNAVMYKLKCEREEKQYTQ